MREIRTSGSTSGMWKRGMEWLLRHRQTKGAENRQATPKLPRHIPTLRAPWEGADLQWVRVPTRQVLLQSVATGAGT